jgi:hypothetical protein
MHPKKEKRREMKKLICKRKVALHFLLGHASLVVAIGPINEIDIP